jgi:CRP/FNR family cyclic AMP-dependent transcriptional regulator
MDADQIPLFTTCTKKQRRSIDSLCTRVTIPVGRHVARQGNRGDECMVLLGGTATVEIDGELIADLGAGDVLGEIAVLEGRTGRQTATVTTTTPCDVLIFTRDEFNQMLVEQPQLAGWVGHIAIGRYVSNLGG